MSDFGIYLADGFNCLGDGLDFQVNSKRLSVDGFTLL